MTDIGDRLRASTKRAIEALVLVAEEPLNSHLLAQLLEVSPTVVDELCGELAGGYESEGRGFQLVRVAGGWRYQTHPDQAPYVERFVLEGQSAKLSAAALETLAIVAYRQPITTPEIHALRGTDPGGVLQNLLEKKLVRVVGRKKVVGRPVLYGTTRDFLSHFGLNSVADLPSLEEFGDMASALQAGSAATPATGLPFEEHAADDDGAAGNGGHEDRVDDDEIERKDDGDHS